MAKSLFGLCHVLIFCSKANGKGNLYICIMISSILFNTHSFHSRAMAFNALFQITIQILWENIAKALTLEAMTRFRLQKQNAQKNNDCGCIWDKDCDGDGWKISNGHNVSSSSLGSCAWLKSKFIHARKQLYSYNIYYNSPLGNVSLLFIVLCFKILVRKRKN